jgi:hypothetical protein
MHLSVQDSSQNSVVLYGRREFMWMKSPVLAVSIALMWLATPFTLSQIMGDRV